MVYQFHNDKDQNSTEWTDIIKRGIEMLYGEYQPEQEMQEFIALWGGFDQETLVRVLTEGQGEHRLLAICIIGESNLQQARALLLPFLQSIQPKERWLSAIYLGRRREELALPVLIIMLTEFLPCKEFSTPEEMSWFAEYRGAVVSTLLLWNDTSLVAAFRHAFAVSVEAERYLPDHPVFRRITLDYWYSYQDNLSYALGSKGAFGALMGIPISPLRQRIAMLKMIIGYKRVEIRRGASELVFGWEENGELKSSMKAMLEQYFGLSEEEQNDYLNNHNRDLRKRGQSLTSLIK